MQNIFDIHDYDENFLEQFTTQTIPIYDLWSIRPLQNDQKEIISGKFDEVDKFRNFIIDHSNQDYPHPLVIVIGNAEKLNPNNISNTSKRYFKLKFEKFKGNDLGTPLTIAGAPQPYPMNNQVPPVFMGVPQGNAANPASSLQGFSLGDIHSIIDRNVNDATRSIKAEYEEQAARREAEAIKRMAELETRMEMYKLEIRENEIAKKEAELRAELEELEQRKLEGLGTVKDYTKTIAGGLFELGKSAFGLDEDKDDEPKAKNKSKSETLSGTTKTSFDDDGFSEIKDEEDNIEIVLQGIANLDEEQRMALLELIISGDSEKTTNKNQPVSVDNTDVSELGDDEDHKQSTIKAQTDNNQTTNGTQSNNNQKIIDNEELQT